jgi:hypothetical protein
MVMAVNTHPLETEIRTRLEAQLQAALENHFRALRGRIAALMEAKGAVSAGFWATEREYLTCVLNGVYRDALRLAFAPQDFGWPKADLHESIGRMAREMAKSVLEAAQGRLGDAVVMPYRASAFRQSLAVGPLSDARAERLAIQQAGPLLSMGKMADARVQRPGEAAFLGIGHESKPTRLCI